jgi:hypothetical protein
MNHAPSVLTRGNTLTRGHTLTRGNTLTRGHTLAAGDALTRGHTLTRRGSAAGFCWLRPFLGRSSRMRSQRSR